MSCSASRSIQGLTSLRVVTYNNDRQERILRECKNKRGTHVIGLQGTMWRHQGRDQYSVRAEGSRVIHWPCTLAKDAAGSNQSAGVALALDERRFPAVTTREVFTPLSSLQGRGGAVRLQRRGGGAYDLLLGVMYWATDTAKPKEIGINNALRRWANEGMYSKPARTAVIWLMDANAKLGVTKGMYGPENAPPGDAVGHACPEVESANGGLFREWMNQQYLLATNTHTKPRAHGGLVPQLLHEWDGGATFRRWDGCRSRLDYVVIPKGMLERVEKIEVLYACAHRLQLANCAQLRDHQPLYVQVKYRVWFDVGSEQRENGLDVNKMMHSWTKGPGMEEYKETVDEWARSLVLDSRWSWAVANDDTDAMMRLLTEGIKEAACLHFSRVSVKGKYNRSERTEPFMRRSNLHREAQRMKTQISSLSLVLRGWQCMVRLQRVDKELGKSRRADRPAMTAGWVAEMHPARWKGDWCEIWRLARRIAGTCLGPKRRTFGDVAALQTTAAGMSAAGCD